MLASGGALFENMVRGEFAVRIGPRTLRAVAVPFEPDGMDTLHMFLTSLESKLGVVLGEDGVTSCIVKDGSRAVSFEAAFVPGRRSVLSRLAAADLLSAHILNVSKSFLHAGRKKDERYAMLPFCIFEPERAVHDAVEGRWTLPLLYDEGYVPSYPLPFWRMRFGIEELAQYVYARREALSPVVKDGHHVVVDPQGFEGAGLRARLRCRDLVVRQRFQCDAARAAAFLDEMEKNGEGVL